MTQRTILFRGKNQSGEWVYGSYVAGIFDDYGHIISNYTHSDYEHGELSLNGANVVSSSTVGQFTGLTDKNGVNIFEGDIVKCPTATEPEENGFIVVYKSYRLFFSNVNYPDLNTYGSDNWEYFSKYSEVIGNIHTK